MKISDISIKIISEEILLDGEKQDGIAMAKTVKKKKKDTVMRVKD